jgi:4-amino-4-deoxy-L-arabinose transferase-like glycosyltransferase
MTRWHTGILFAGAFVLFIWGTWQLPFIGPDEPRYAQVAREMLESSDYFVPRLGGFAWFEKPVLLYWLIAISYFIFGVSEFAARIPSVLSALGSIACVYVTLHRIADQRIAILSAAVLSSTAFFIGFSHAATFDMLLTFCVTGALCSYLLYERLQKSKFLILLYLFSGLGILAKGFVALILIGLPLVSYLIFSRQWKIFLSLKPIHGILILAAVACLWFVPVSIIYGSRFWNEFVYQHHFLRYTSSYYHRSQGIFFYVPVLLAGTYPWSFAVFSARPAGDRNLIKFLLFWLICPIAFFSLSQSKLPGYILPAVPGLAILTGLSIANLTKPFRFILLFAILNVILIAAFFWAAKKYGVPIEPFYWMIATIAICTLLLLFYHKFYLSFIINPLIMFIGMVLFVSLIYPQLGWDDSKKLSVEWNHTTRESKLVPYNLYDFSPVFYTNRRMELNPQGYPQILTNASQLHAYLMKTGEAHVLTHNEDLDWMKSASFWRVNRIIPGKQISIIELMPLTQRRQDAK